MEGMMGGQSIVKEILPYLFIRAMTADTSVRFKLLLKYQKSPKLETRTSMLRIDYTVYEKITVIQGALLT